MRSARQLLANKVVPFNKLEAFQKMTALPTITLTAQEAETFIEWCWDESMMKYYASKEVMKTATKNIRGLGWGSSRFLYPEAYFDDSKVTKTFTETSIQVTSKELRGGVLIKDADLEDINVGTAAGFKAAIMRMIAKTVANELEEILWISDTQSLSGFAVDDTRSLFDGVRYRLDNSQSGETYENAVTGSTVILDASNTVTAAAASYSIATSQGIVETDASAPYAQEIKFAKMLQWLPAKYKKGGLDKLRFFCNDAILYNFTEAMQARQTTLGDTAIMGRTFTTYNMVPIIPCPLMPVTMAIDSVLTQHEKLDTTTPGTLTDCVLTPEGNFGYAVQLEMTVEPERQAESRGTVFYYTTRIDTFVRDVAACVLLKRLKVV